MTTKINATNGELVNLTNGLFAVQDLKGKKFGLLVSKNLTILQNELKDLEESSKPSPEFLELAQKVNKLANEDEEGAQEKIDQLEQEHLEIVTFRKKQVEETTEKLQLEASVELITISEKWLPEEITAKQINNLQQIIK